MGKTFVEDERPCDQCVNRTRYGCASWDCKFIDRDEAIKAWKEKHEMADRKTEPQTIRCPKCGRTDYIRDMEKDMGIKGSCYEYKCINCNTYIKDEPQIDGAIDEARFKAHCMNCQRDVADIKCLDCDGDKYFIPDEPQTEREDE